MSTARVIRLDAPRQEAWNSLIERYGQQFIAIEAREDATSWEKAQLVKAFDEETKTHPAMLDKKPHDISKQANTDLRQWLGQQRKPGIRPRFMADARKVYTLWGDLDILAGKDILSYESYRHMANCGLPREQKDDLRDWAERHQPARNELRQTIRERVDATKGIYRPDFDLKVSNHWVFQVDKRTDGFDGGVNYDLYANL